MDLLRTSQTELLKITGIICVVLGLMASVIKYRSVRMKKSLVLLEFGAGILLIADMYAYFYRGNFSTLGYWMVRISNFLVFFMINFETYALNTFIISQLMGREKLRKLPRRNLAVYILSSIGMALVVISQFTGLYYTFDATNRYQRAPAWILSYIIPVTSLLIMLSLVYQYRKYLSRGVCFSLMVFSVFPLAAGVLQNYYYGFSFLNITIGVMAMVVYMFSLIDQNSLLLRSANTDSMTELPNQYGFLCETEKKIMQHEISRYNSFYFDIVRMGQFNRRYGNEAGDLIIKKYAAYIAANIDRDEVLSRLGGNFFIGLVKKENSDKFVAMIQDVPVELKIGGQTEKISVSAVAGGYEIKDNNIVGEQVIGNAALAVGIAKNVRKVQFLYLTEELQKELQENRMLEERIPAAIQNEEFVPYYQPKVNLETMELCGAEALARWEHDNTTVPPGKFVPLMERNGMVCSLDFCILEQVCRDIVKWLAEGVTPPRISVNFSRKNLGNPILAEAIFNVVNKYEISPDFIQVEITETIDEFPLSYLKGVVEALQRYGFTVAIDDFGTGSSSINLLREVYFDVMKIDRQFIECRSEKETKILERIIELAGDIDSRVIAEGVELPEQLEKLRKLGCSEIQGYIFDKPLRKKDFEERMANIKYKV